MRARNRLSTRAVLPSVAAFIAGAAGIAVADIVAPDGGGVVNACYKTADGTGQVRFVNKQPSDCTAGEAGVSFNQSGPQGPAGAPGAPGPAGAAGAPGDAGVRVFSRARHTPQSGGTTLQLTSLPAGRYLVLATADYFGELTCRLVEGGRHEVGYATGVSRTPARSRPTGFENRGSLTVAGEAAVPAFGRLRLLCNARDSTIFTHESLDGEPAWARLVAVRLGAVAEARAPA